jgi:hypothetical protein
MRKRTSILKNGRKEITKGLTVACIGYWVKKGFGVSEEIGILPWGRRRADVLAIKMDGNIVVCEVKSCVSDFTSDKKWESYLPNSNKMYFVVYGDWIDKYADAIKEKGVGIMKLSKRTGHIYVSHNAKWRPMTGKDKKRIVLKIAWRASQYNKSNTYRTKVFL